MTLTLPVICSLKRCLSCWNFDVCLSPKWYPTMLWCRSARSYSLFWWAFCIFFETNIKFSWNISVLLQKQTEKQIQGFICTVKCRVIGNFLQGACLFEKMGGYFRDTKKIPGQKCYSKSLVTSAMEWESERQG